MTNQTNMHVGDSVKVKGFGPGVITLVSSASNEDGEHTVYHVKLESGETRHFTEEDVKKGGGNKDAE